MSARGPDQALANKNKNQEWRAALAGRSGCQPSPVDISSGLD
jgi:hypothetical protein